jgi:hypothetical protein
MSSIMHNAVYNSRIVGMLTPSSSRLGRLLLILPMLLLATTALAQDWAAVGEQQLAAKILATTSARAMNVEVSNRSSLRAPSADDVRRGLLAQLAALGARFVNAEQAAVSVRVSLSEDLQNYVWVAEVREGANEAAVVMISVPRPVMTAAEPEASAMVLHKNTLWSQPERILDIAVTEGNPAHMIVLDGNGVMLYRLQDGRWQMEQSLPITHSHPWPRDLRGRLVSRKDHWFDVYLPGVFCQSTAGSPLAMTCSDNDNPWPLGTDQIGINAPYIASRNFFGGALSPPLGKRAVVPPFYSAAGIPRDKNTLWLFAMVDGQVHLLDGSTDQVIAASGWGSDIATVRSACGSGWQILATGKGESTRDSLRAFELPGREPVGMSAPLDINGRITSLWTEWGGSGVVAVARNNDAGGYEAFRLTVTCGR